MPIYGMPGDSFVWQILVGAGTHAGFFLLRVAWHWVRFKPVKRQVADHMWCVSTYQLSLA